MRRSLPIKCLEAVFLGLYLTAGMEELDRTPVGFKTEVGGHVYRHIVLVIRHRPSNKYGALGLSRRVELMYKELGYESMSAILSDYKESYEAWWHTVEKVRVGLPVSHDALSTKSVCWRYYAYNLSKAKSWEKLCKDMDKHSAASSSKLYDKWLVTGLKHNDIKRQERKTTYKLTTKMSSSMKATKKLNPRSSAQAATESSEAAPESSCQPAPKNSKQPNETDANAILRQSSEPRLCSPSPAAIPDNP
eukprot:5600442-Pyramimonas_sp.AAC.1